MRGRDEFYNLTAMGQPHQSLPWVRFGDYLVPGAVAWILRPIGSGPTVRAEYVMGRDGRPVCTRVEFTGGAKRGVTTADLAAVPGLDRKAVDAFRAFGRLVDVPTAEGPETTVEAIRRMHSVYDVDERAVGEAMRGTSRQRLEAVADVYRRNIDNNPAQAVEAAFPQMSRRTVDRRIKEAREQGLLPPTTPGRKRA